MHKDMIIMSKLNQKQAYQAGIRAAQVRIKAENFAFFFEDYIDKNDPVWQKVWATYSDEVEEFVDLAAETWNGGIRQWVENGYGKQRRSVSSFLQKIGGKASEWGRMLANSKNPKRDDEVLTDFFYKNDDQIMKEVANYFHNRYLDAHPELNAG